MRRHRCYLGSGCGRAFVMDVIVLWVTKIYPLVRIIRVNILVLLLMMLLMLLMMLLLMVLLLMLLLLLLMLGLMLLMVDLRCADVRWWRHTGTGWESRVSVMRDGPLRRDRQTMWRRRRWVECSSDARLLPL